ncbi:unnamed protein product [Protopolystoma xenopodis]|uniref:Uncharacterized protein n=1 Tax=Protopolystoma xenopodis TaxID=117903 RepID=A0A448XQF8_9PLAT|nr:unnamed protein product [Protopolystoma xenopodis]
MLSSEKHSSPSKGEALTLVSKPGQAITGASGSGASRRRRKSVLTQQISGGGAGTDQPTRPAANEDQTIVEKSLSAIADEEAAANLAMERWRSSAICLVRVGLKRIFDELELIFTDVDQKPINPTLSLPKQPGL